MLLHHLASLPSPGQVEPPEHERYRSDLPLPQVFVQLDQDPQVDQLASAVNKPFDQKTHRVCDNYNITTHPPGQALLLHSLSSTLTPEQVVARPPMQERLLLDLPPPQLLLQPFQDPQLDQLASAATRRIRKDLYVISLSNETHLDMCCCYTALSEFHLPSNQSHQRMSAAFQISLRHSSLCKYSRIPNLTR